MLGELLALAATLVGRDQVRRRVLGADQGQRADPLHGGRHHHDGRDARLCPVRRGEASRRCPAAPAIPCRELLGKGYLAFTVDQGPDTERYQGIVELNGATLAECAHNYFRQSEQMDAAVKLAVGRVASDGGDAWRAAGMMVQRLPEAAPRRLLSGESADEEVEEGWRRAVIMMGASTTGELLDPRLHPHRLLYRLFHEDGVRVYGPVELSAGCRCSRARVESTLRPFPREEIGDMKIDGKVVVTCEFCSTDYVFDDADLDHLYRA